jgi:hypothetical protein
MKLYLEKVNGQYKLSIIKDDGKKEKFDYIKFINILYEGNELEEVQYGDKITQEEKSQIDKMLEDIKNVVKAK